MDDAAVLLGAVAFAAGKHRDQRRKGVEASPYINHPIEVADLLARVGGVTDLSTLVAAVLHDTVEDTDATPQELESLFGSRVRGLVEEVSDDKTRPKDERKRLQIEHAPHLSTAAKLIKLADKIANVRDVTRHPAADWSRERRQEYLHWSEQVVAGCRGVNEALEREFAAAVNDGRAVLSKTDLAIPPPGFSGA